MGTFVDPALYRIIREDNVTKVKLVAAGSGEVTIDNTRLEQLGRDLVAQAQINNALDELYRPKAEQ